LVAAATRNRSFFAGVHGFEYGSAQLFKKITDLLDDSRDQLVQAMQLATTTHLDPLTASELHFCAAMQAFYVERWYAEDAHLLKLTGWRGGNRKRDRSRLLEARGHALRSVTTLGELTGSEDPDLRGETMKVLGTITGFMGGDISRTDFGERLGTSMKAMATLGVCDDLTEKGLMRTMPVLYSIAATAARWSIGPCLHLSGTSFLPGADAGWARAMRGPAA
jgi:hypothetical protein